jgi:hypothetical protein
MKWKDIWKEEPPIFTEILFKLGNGNVHNGEIYDREKLRKCRFYSHVTDKDYECDTLTPLSERVLFWYPIPQDHEDE